MTIDEGIEYDRAVTQAELYEYVCKEGFDVSDFSDRFLNSEFCGRSMDANYSRHQLEFPELLASYVFEEVVPKKAEENFVPEEVAWWVGYMYRQLSLKYHITSRNIVRQLPFEKIARRYNGLHIVDDDIALELLRNAIFRG